MTMKPIRRALNKVRSQMRGELGHLIYVNPTGKGWDYTILEYSTLTGEWRTRDSGYVEEIIISEDCSFKTTLDVDNRVTISSGDIYILEWYIADKTLIIREAGGPL